VREIWGDLVKSMRTEMISCTIFGAAGIPGKFVIHRYLEKNKIQMKWEIKKKRISLSLALEKRKEKFLSNGRICLYSSQPTWEATYVPHSPPAPPPPPEKDIELADALLLLLLRFLFFFFFPLRLHSKKCCGRPRSRFNKIRSWMTSRHHPQCIGLL